MASIIKKMESPVGDLTLIVSTENGDITLGFDGLPWHTHGDVLAGEYQVFNGLMLTEEEAVTRFVDELQNDLIPLVISIKNGAIADVWPTRDIEREMEGRLPNETLVFQYWSGRAWNAG